MRQMSLNVMVGGFVRCGGGVEVRWCVRVDVRIDVTAKENSITREKYCEYDCLPSEW